MGPTTAIATHTTSQNNCTQDGRGTIDTGCAPGPRHRDGVDMPGAGLHPHREAMHKQHTEPGPPCCVSFGDPHVHKVARSENQAGMQPQQRKHIGANPPCGEDTPGRRQVQIKEKEGGTSAKGSVLRLTCVPLPHLVVPLSGCACSVTPTKATRGDARGHP